MTNKLFQVSSQHDRSVKDMINTALEDLGGLRQIIPSGKRILIKPNLVIAKTYNTGATTNPEVIEALIQEVLKTNPAEIVLGESSTAGDNTMKAFQVTGMDKIAQKYGVKVIDFKKTPVIDTDIPLGKEIKNVKIFQPIFEYDYLINVPILKIHGETTVTIGMKNLKGCIHDKEKHRFHRLNLHQCIVDLNTVIKPDLTVVDATTCSLQWELGGDPVKLDTIMMGKNVLAVDMVAASLLGYGVEDVQHLKIASQSGIGPRSLAEIEVFNPPDTQTKKIVLDASQKKSPEYRLHYLDIVEKGTCSSCKGALVAAMRRLSREGYSPECVVAMGQLLTDEKEKIQQAKDKGLSIVGIGKCGCKVVQGYSAENIKGCPARAEQIYGILKKL
jgi:uncharacterized protein (DUF362 family)